MNEIQERDAMIITEVEGEVTSNAAVNALTTVIAGYEQLKVLTIRTQAQHDEYNEIWLGIKDAMKVTEGLRKSIVAPHNKRVDVINGFFRALAGKLKPKADEFERALIKWRTDQEKKEQERLRKLREEEQKKLAAHEKEVEEAVEKGEEPPPPPPVAAPIKPRTSNVQRGAAGTSHSYIDTEVTVEDMKKLAKAVADGDLPERVLDYRLKELKDIANAGIDLSKFGCKVEKVRKLRSRIG